MKATNLISRRFGILTVESRVANDKHGRTRWLCRCDCGNAVEALGTHLKRGAVISCKCARRSNLYGKQFGKLAVREYAGIGKGGNTLWACTCYCGAETVVPANSLLLGRTRSCGCKSSCGQISGTYWCSIRNGANSRGLALDLSIQEAWDLFCEQKSTCSLSGVEIGFNSPQTASLDRIDSSQGYRKNNVQWIHKDFNFMKGALDQVKFISLCKKVANYHKSST